MTRASNATLPSWVDGAGVGSPIAEARDGATINGHAQPDGVAGGSLDPAGKASPKKSDDSAGRRTQATALIEIAAGDGVDLFHTPDGTGFADICMRGHRETLPLRGRAFGRWLKHAYYIETGGAPNSDAMSTAMGVIEAKAHYDGEERKVCLRLAEHQGKIYLDQCDPTWAAIEIDADGWRKVQTPPVRFRRTPGMLPIPDPVPGGKIDELRKHLHVDDTTFVLIVSWLLAILRGRGPYPILAFTGEQGTGKSMTAEKI